MIIHGNKQISEIVYARKASEGGGAVAISNIISGAQVVFGGLKPLFVWLEKAAGKAILAAFGQTDGKAVIKATNAYLNALAATDPTKATALAGFINEDPMLVCSIGLQPQGVQMPIRWLVGDGNSTIDTGHTPTPSIKTHTLFKLPNNDSSVYGSAISHNSRTFELYGYNGGEINYGNYYQIVGGLVGNRVELTSNANVFKYKVNNGSEVTRTFGAFTGTFPYDLSLFANRRGAMPTTGVSGVEIAFYEIEDENDFKENLVPFVSQTRNGMVDLETMTFHPNQGTGTFGTGYTLQDGVTPWTPLNQTP